MIDRKRTACFTGHRKIHAQQVRNIEKQLDEIIEKLYQKGVIFYGAGGSYGFESSDLDGTDLRAKMLEMASELRTIFSGRVL